MQIIRLLLISGFLSLPALAGEERITPEEVTGSAQVWLTENVEPWVFDAAGVDPQEVKEALGVIQEELSQPSPAVVEPERADAGQLVRVLSEFNSTRPYAAQLHGMLDQLSAPAPSTNLPVPPPSRLTPEESRNAWLSIVAKRPPPARAQFYLSQAKKILAEEQVPAELAWVAEVESAFNPDARSPVGAAGLFQLMPDTAKSLGLSIWFPDERNNPAKNTRAAAKYLHYLHDRFGDWQLAVAAYNAGPTRVARLLRESQDYSYEAIAHRVPPETLAYVAKVEATLQIREGASLSQLDSPLTTAAN